MTSQSEYIAGPGKSSKTPPAPENHSVLSEPGSLFPFPGQPSAADTFYPTHRDSFCRIRIAPPCNRTITCRVRPQDTGQEIIRFLTGRFPFRSEQVWSERLRSGWITQGDRRLKPGDTLADEPALSIFQPGFTEPAVPDEIQILDKHPEFLLVYKPAPLPMHPGGRYYRNTLLSILQEEAGENPGFASQSNGFATGQNPARESGLHILHRLDAVTTGLVLFGRNPDFSGRVRQAFETGRVSKHYFAIVSGVPDEQAVTIDRPIRRKNGYLFECAPGGKPALTEFRVLRTNGSSALVACRPATGRTHQIRLHLREWGHPIIDDPVYGNRTVQPGTRRPAGKTNGFPMQNSAISLVHHAMEIPSLNLSFHLSGYREALQP
ncbi:pseudouridine synthase [Balneolales bacterium ANBcel1]|nr:pseudouridine synthase [Balneolales bacterium ANBcel1]